MERMRSGSSVTGDLSSRRDVERKTDLHANASIPDEFPLLIFLQIREEITPFSTSSD